MEVHRSYIVGVEFRHGIQFLLDGTRVPRVTPRYICRAARLTLDDVVPGLLAAMRAPEPEPVPAPEPAPEPVEHVEPVPAVPEPPAAPVPAVPAAPVKPKRIRIRNRRKDGSPPPPPRPKTPNPRPEYALPLDDPIVLAYSIMCCRFRAKAAALSYQHGHTPDDIDDLQQEFLVRLVYVQHLFNPKRARWCTFLNRVVKNHLYNLGEHRRARCRDHRLTLLIG